MRNAVIACLWLASPALADDIGSAPRGATLAQEICAVCHAVTRGETSPDPDAPGFAEVADLVSTTRQSLFVFLNTPHPSMPNIILEREESDDLIAYILSLRAE
ncbi:MAG: cytochrome c [Paracoccaceae bacterium]|nr:cytochrome c [Paracoccaceae bacterium]